MRKSALFGFMGAVVLLTAMPLYAQNGCTDSPENPTAVLALVGGAGALFSVLRARIKARRAIGVCREFPSVVLAMGVYC
jgi:XrtJ-associated TM-motif-TM protein